MSRRKSTSSGPRLALPWEHGQRAWAALFSGRRMWPLLSLLAVVGTGVLAFVLGKRRTDLLTTRATVIEVQRAARSFVRDLGRCPHSVTELVHPPRSGVQYLLETPHDAWGRSLYLRCAFGEPTKIEVVSAGPSGSFLDDDNIM